MKFREHRVRWSALAALALGAAGSVHAYDDELVQSHMQPFVGAYMGLYKPNLDDLKGMAPGKNDFSSVMPGGGVELGVAYDRFHVGISIGYQPKSHGDLTGAEAASAADTMPIAFANVKKSVVTGKASDSSTTVIVASQYGVFPYYTKYSYDMLPIELFVDATMFKNSSAINFLAGGSVGLSLVSLTLPYPGYYRADGDTIKFYRGTNGADHEVLFNVSGYVGARINLADRLNLEGQIGWRFAFTDEIYVSDMDAELLRDHFSYKLVQTNLGYYDRVYDGYAANQKLDLSGPYARADLRWTFASKSEREMDRSSARRESLTRGMLAAAERSHR